MGLAAAVLHWPPDVFWRSTVPEFWAAMDAITEINTME